MKARQADSITTMSPGTLRLGTLPQQRMEPSGIDPGRASMTVKARFLIAVTLGMSGSLCFAQHQLPEAAAEANAAGATVYTQFCAVCHGREGVAGADPRAPKLETLRVYPPERVLDALTTGKMKLQGDAMQDAQKKDVSEWVAGRKIGSVAIITAESMPNRCTAAKAINLKTGWNGWGADMGNSRFQSARAAGFNMSAVPRLKLKWAFGFPGGTQVSSQATVVGGWLFIGSDSGHIYALDAATGCVHWTFKAEAAVRTAPTVATLRESGGPATIFIGDLQGKAYAIDAASGKLVWSTQIDQRPAIRIMGATAVYGGRVFVGVSSGEEGALGRAGYECCRFRGSVSALDSASGKIVWQTYIVDEPKPLPVDSTGVRRWGPSGGGVWSTPTIDPKRKRIYVGTGNAYTAPAGPLNDSIVALDMASGAVAWSHQDTPDDVWLFGCKPGRAGCPDVVGPDWDFASSPMLKKLPNGREVVVAAHKGGVAMALDLDKGGAVVWRTNMAAKPPTFYGDVLFGGAADATQTYFALQETAAVVALDLKDGTQRWSKPLTLIEGRARRVGAGAAVTVMPGVVFSGSWDGVLRAYATKDGSELWSFDSVRSFDTVNGIPAKGGSMGGPGATLAGGMLFVGSGYVGVSNGMPGNVLLAFAP